MAERRSEGKGGARNGLNEEAKKQWQRAVRVMFRQYEMGMALGIVITISLKQVPVNPKKKWRYSR